MITDDGVNAGLTQTFAAAAVAVWISEN